MVIQRRFLRRQIIYFLAVFLSCVVTLVSAAWAETVPEYQIKAAFLYKFLLFTEWPEEAFAESEDTIIIGIVGNDPFGEAFKRVKGEDVKGKRLAIQRFDRETPASSLRKCHLLFIGPSHEMRMDEFLESLSDLPMLTVSDVNGFCESGGMINLVIKKNTVRFEINIEPAERAGIKFRAQLLRVADRIVGDSHTDGRTKE